MRNTILVLILFLAVFFLTGCLPDEAETSATKGVKRDLGKGFYTIEAHSELMEGSSEKYYLSVDLYYKNKKIDEALYAYISPSGRFAVYESMIHGGIVLFDAKRAKKYRVIKGAVPSVETWSKNEEIFVMSYHPTSNEKRMIRVSISKLELLEEE